MNGFDQKPADQTAPAAVTGDEEVMAAEVDAEEANENTEAVADGEMTPKVVAEGETQESDEEAAA